jgi:ATP-dependent Lon protease
MTEDIQKLQDKLKAVDIPEELKEKLDLLITRLERMSRFENYSSEYETLSRYINVISTYPWNRYSEDNLDLEHAKYVLDKNHFGINNVKERVLEYLAIMNLNRNQAAPIICFVGLQGIGKTTMSKSISEALGRKFIRISLGGMASVLDIRGQSKVNPDAEEGYIIKSMTRAGTSNPVILLDEIDKISDESNLRSGIFAALLEILDPEQNTSFLDHYLDFPVNLSKAMFILTANNLGTISSALLDRLEIIRFSSYTDEEKMRIAKEYLLPKVYKETGLQQDEFKINEDVWTNIVRPLGYEAGIRELERTIMAIARKAAKQILLKETSMVVITNENLKSYLPERY